MKVASTVWRGADRKGTEIVTSLVAYPSQQRILPILLVRMLIQPTKSL